MVRLRCLAGDGRPVWDVVTTTGVGGTNPDPDVRCVSPLARAKGSGRVYIPTTGVTPLSLGEQKRVRAKVTKETRTIDGRVCRVHAFEWRATRPERGRASGTACLDEETDLPLVVQIEPRDPPDGIERLSYVTHYGPVLEDRWAIVRAEVDLWIEDPDGGESAAHVSVQMSGHVASADLPRGGACER